jgi:glutathione S-transferase
MLTLYHHPRTRSSRFIFLLEELGAPYGIHPIASIRRPDGSGGVDPENPHPHGKSPVLKDGDTLVFESTAIALYLTDKFTQNGLDPVVGDPLRGAYVSWLAYYAGVMEPAWMSQYMKWDIPRGTAGWVPVNEVMAFVNATLEKGPYILGEKFSAVDILIATTFKMFLGSPLLEKTPLLEAYVKRVTDRPAYARAQAKENG